LDIDIRIGDESMSLDIENPHRFNVADVMGDIMNFGKKSNVDLTPLEIDRLIPKMIRGVAGCEGGCPADAKSLVKEGFGKFHLEYVEGGILTANQSLENNSVLQIKIFPDF
jgi:hypothetical protein